MQDTKRGDGSDGLTIAWSFSILYEKVAEMRFFVPYREGPLCSEIHQQAKPDNRKQ